MFAGYRPRNALRSESRRAPKWWTQIELNGHCSIAAATPCFDWTSQACPRNLPHSASQSGSVEWLRLLRVRCGGAGRVRRPSGLPCIADALLRCREPPLGAMNGLMRCSKNLSFDYPISDGEQARRDGEPERPGGLEVDDQLDFGGLLDWQVGRFFPFEYTADVAAGLAI
jgi:hypothetical protein